MASPAPDGTSACAAASTWLCGLMAGLSDTNNLFSAFPILGFVIISALGGGVGWCLLVELGQFDEADRRKVMRSLLLRAVIGACVGVIGYAAWSTSGDPEKGMWMLYAAVAAAFPAEASQTARKLFEKLIDLLGSLKR